MQHKGQIHMTLLTQPIGRKPHEKPPLYIFVTDMGITVSYPIVYKARPQISL